MHVSSTPRRSFVTQLSSASVPPHFGLVEFRQFLFPLGGLIRAPRLLVELRQALQGFLQTNSWFRGNFFDALLHSFITAKQQRFGLGIFLLLKQAAAQQAVSIEGPPVVWNALFANGENLNEQRLGLRRPAKAAEEASQS